MLQQVTLAQNMAFSWLRKPQSYKQSLLDFTRVMNSFNIVLRCILLTLTTEPVASGECCKTVSHTEKTDSVRAYSPVCNHTQPMSPSDVEGHCSEDSNVQNSTFKDSVSVTQLLHHQNECRIFSLGLALPKPRHALVHML